MICSLTSICLFEIMFISGPYVVGLQRRTGESWIRSFWMVLIAGDLPPEEGVSAAGRPIKLRNHDQNSVQQLVAAARTNNLPHHDDPSAIHSSIGGFSLHCFMNNGSAYQL